MKEKEEKGKEVESCFDFMEQKAQVSFFLTSREACQTGFLEELSTRKTYSTL